MSNSKLVTYKRISPNSNPRRSKIRKITIHHIAGRISLQTLGNVFASRSRQASSNYGVDNDGKVGMYVEEKNRAWTSSNAKNDHESVTIEVANSRVGGNWAVSDKALEGTINLCVDICKRNGIKSLNYTGDSRGNLTRHNMFQNTNCPGPYLQSKFPYIASEVNKRLGSNVRPTSPVSRNISPVVRNISPVSRNTIAVDGYWGPATTRALQKTLGTYVDGVISGQYKNSVTSAISSVRFGTSGSSVIKALQRKVGSKVDGYIGPATVKALQRYLKTPVDGIISRPSKMVKEMQKRLNAGTF